MEKEIESKMETLLKIAADKTRIKIMFALLDDSKCDCHCGASGCGTCSCLSCMIEKCVGDIVKEAKSKFIAGGRFGMGPTTNGRRAWYTRCRK